MVHRLTGLICTQHGFCRQSIFLLLQIKKTIVSVDQQLYAKCIQLKSRNEISENFVFYMGELHIAFSMLKAIGKCTDSSGLDELFVEAAIHGPSTVEQLKGGKYMKRSFEEFLILYIALFKLYINHS